MLWGGIIPTKEKIQNYKKKPEKRNGEIMKHDGKKEHVYLQLILQV
jgi:hypothetical protein